MENRARQLFVCHQIYIVATIAALFFIVVLFKDIAQNGTGRNIQGGRDTTIPVQTIGFDDNTGWYNMKIDYHNLGQYHACFSTRLMFNNTHSGHVLCSLDLLDLLGNIILVDHIHNGITHLSLSETKTVVRTIQIHLILL